MARNDQGVAIYTACDGDLPFDPSSPEKNLLAALLITAMADVKKSGNVRKAALDYFLNDSDEYIFSFQSVCAYLNIDPTFILRKVGLEEGYSKDLDKAEMENQAVAS